MVGLLHTQIYIDTEAKCMCTLHSVAAMHIICIEELWCKVQFLFLHYAIGLK